MSAQAVAAAASKVLTGEAQVVAGDKTAAAASAAAGSQAKVGQEKKVGVGMGVKPVVGADKVQTGLTVSKLVAGGPADESKRVEEGHMLDMVDGVDVRSWPLKKLASEMMLGLQGSKVQLTLRSKASGELKTVELVRR